MFNRQPIAVKNSILFSLLTLILISVISLFSFNLNSKSVLEKQLASIEFEASEKISRFSEWIATGESNVLFLAGTPPIQGIVRALEAGGIDPLNGSSVDIWRARLEQIFTKFIEHHPNYAQIRFIGGWGRGMELVRVERNEGGIVAIAADDLQDKSEHDYVDETKRTPLGKVYSSPINLNREHGRVAKPHMPTLRLATPVQFQDRVFGLLVINLDMTTSLREFTTAFPWPAEISLFDKEGTLLASPDPDQLFGKDLESGVTMALTEPEVWERFQGLFQRQQDEPTAQIEMLENQVRYVGRFRLGNTVSSRDLGVSIRMYEEAALQELKENQELIILASLLTMMAGALFVGLLSRRLSRPIAGLSEGLVQFSRGKEVSLSPQPLNSRDEVAQLTNAFLDMREEIGRRAQQLREQEQRLSSIFKATLDGIVLTDETGDIISTNPAMEQQFGYEPGELIGRNVRILASSPHQENHDQYIDNYLTGKGGHIVGGRHELVGIRKDGSFIDVTFSLNAYRIGEMTFFTGVMHDISDRKRLEEKLKEANRTLEARVLKRTEELERVNHGLRQEMELHRQTRARLFIANQIFEKASQAILITDAENKILDVNPTYTQMTGFSIEDVRGKNPSLSQSGRHDKSFYQAMWEQLTNKNHWEGEIWDRRANGAIFPKFLTIDRVLDDKGELLNYVAMFQDLSEQKATEQELEKRTHFDPLTGLPNRSLFRNRLAHEFEVADRHQRKVALISVNIDRFKQVNDSFGYNVGDNLLIEVSKRLEKAIRNTDLVARNSQTPERDADHISRTSGDEFAFILTDLKEAENSVIATRRIIGQMEQPFLMEEQEVFLTCSLGISIYPENAQTLDGQVLCAERALEQAKAKGGGQFQFYSEEMNSRSLEKLRLETDMRRAIKEREFQLHYQPKLDLASGQVSGMEALVRWEKPSGDRVFPDAFIPLAESTGQIVPLGEWILRQACEDCVRLNVENGWNLKTAVNLSARQFMQPNLIEMVEIIIKETGIPADCLELEITESMVMEDHEQAVQTMKGLRGLGLTLSIDDFGTGYSSLAYLRTFPVDALKIDQSFVRTLEVDSEDASIVGAICAMGRSLHLKVVAEGVETEEQLEFLRKNDCDLIQGYHISRPVPIESFEIFVSQWV